MGRQGWWGGKGGGAARVVGRQGWWGGKGGGAVSGIILLYLLRLTLLAFILTILTSLYLLTILLYLLRLTLLAFILTSNYTKYIVSVCQLVHIYLCLQELNLET